KKAPELLIDAFSSLQLKHVRLLVVGNGLLEKELKLKAAGDARILFIDFQNQQQMPVVYRLGDVFVLPSNGPGETWGLSVNEAMACGKPVIVSDKCGCAADLVKGNGFVFESGNREALTQLLNQVITKRDQLPKFALISKQQIESFSLQRIAQVIEERV
nr:glycosyltransferase family 4 protein [Lacibacter sp.]